MYYGTLDGYLKAVDMESGDELYRFKTPSGIIGNVTTYEHDGKQFIAVLSGIGGRWHLRPTGWPSMMRKRSWAPNDPIRQMGWAMVVSAGRTRPKEGRSWHRRRVD